MMFSVRIVNSDFYLADPIANLDPSNSKFREDATVSKVPVIRIYGATPSGQKTCLHVHGIFPYIYVPYDGTQPTDKYLKQFATSVDFAVQVALGRASSSRQHVFEITVVKGIPYYGYHEGGRDFLKIVLFNPFLVTRIVSLLQNGAIMNKVFQPHEAHIPYLLQFFMDYNLYGMNLLHVSAVKFRSPVRLLDGEVDTVTSSIQRSNSPQSTPASFAASLMQIWNEDTVSRDWVLGSEVERLSFCELEVDILASDILNKLEIGVNIGTNPGLAAIWEDEQQRRREANESSQISAPPTQDRGFIEETATEKKFKERLREIIEERDVLIQSQMGKLGREALSPQELASFQDSISTFAASQKDRAGDISSDANVLLQLLSQTADDSIAESSKVVIDEDEPVVNQSIVQEVVEASQRSFSQDLSSTLDKEMVDILTSLAEESSQPGSQKPALSQSILLDQGDAELDEEANDDEELSEADESIMMSQRVWDDIEPQLVETGDEKMADVQESDIASQRVSQYDLEGMSDTWVGSFLGGDIPQLDGAADEDSDGEGDFKLTRGKRKKGDPGYRADKTSKQPDVMLFAPRGNSQRIPVTPEEARRNMERGKTEESGESISVDVWPQAARAIRTYSRKGMSVLKSQSSATLHEVDSTAKKNNKDIIVVDTEKEMANSTKIEGCEDEFRLFLSESSDSEDNMTKEGKLGSKRNDVIGRQRNDLSVKQCEAIKSNFSSVRKDQGRSDESYTPVITKYFHSPEKNTEHVRKQNEETPRSIDDPTVSSFTVGEHSLVQMSPQCSKQCQGYSRKSALRKRKLPEFGVKSERRFSKRTSLRRTRQNTDLAASLNAVSGAMADLRVFIKDVSDTPALSSKLDEAQKRLTRRQENLCENSTNVNQKLSSLARTERLPGTSSPLQLGKNEKSPLTKRRRENLCENSTHLNQKLSGLARKERLPGTSSPLRLRKNEKSPLTKKRSSPKGKEERMKKYGNLPVVIAKSPKKNFTADIVASETHLLTEEKCFFTDSTPVSRQCQDVPSIHSSETPCVLPVTLNSGTGRVSSRLSHTRVPGLISSRTIATATAEGKKETSRSVPLSSRELSLKSARINTRNKSHSEKDHVLSLQRKGLKRKLKLGTERDVQSATVKNLPGVRKKRKLSLTLKEDKSRSDLREECAGETFASSAENRLIEEYKSTCEAKYEISNAQHVRFDIENNDSSLRSGSGKDVALNTGLSDDIICIPSSPGDSDSNDGSPNRAGSSASVVESTSFLVSTKTCNKSEHVSNTSVSDERERRPLEKLNCLALVSRGTYVSEEKDTELLANALFNMSYPSPLPCLEECHSPPYPSSPLDVKRDSSDPRSQHNMVQLQKFFSESSNIAEEDGKVLDDVELKRIPASCPSEVQQTAFFSPADMRLREKSLHLQMRPQLGETQSQFENTSSENSDTNVSKQLECKSTEIENGADSFDQRVDDKEMSCDKESFDSRENLKNEARTMEESIIEQRKDSELNSGPAIVGEKSRGRTIAYNSESLESFAGLECPQSVRTESLKQTSRTYLTETEERSLISTVEKEFVLELSTAEDISSNSQPLVRGDLQTREMEISIGEENQIQGISSENIPDANSPVLPTTPEDHNKNQSCNIPVKQSDPNSSSVALKGNDRLGDESLVAIEPLKRPPSSQELINSLKDYGLPHCRYQAPFCSDPDDIPTCPREVGGRILRIESKQVSNLPEFESSSSLQGLKHWRFVLSSARECSVRDIYQSIEDATNIAKNLQLKMALMGEGEVVITPCRGPPAYEAVKAWAREKLAKRGLQKKEKNPALKKLELKQTTSNDGNLENVEEKQLSGQRNVDLVVSNASKIKLGQAMPVTTTPKVPPEEVTTQVKRSSVDAKFEPLVESKQKTLDDVESEQRMDVVESSDSSSAVEVTSPCSLFSPNELKTFTFASGTLQEIARHKSIKGTQAENQYPNTIAGTQPMRIDEALPLSAPSDKQFSEPKDALALGSSSVTVTPSALHSPDGSPSTTEQPLSPILQSQCPVFAAPYHSTPVATKLVYGVQSPRCTPISDATKAKRLKTNAETSGKKNLGNQASTDQTTLRQQLLSSQFKFVTPGSEPRRPMPWSSQIEGPSPNNTFGFKVTQVNLKDAKALHEVQHLTLFSLELHVRTRRDSRPDPEFDPICAIFYYIQTDTSLASGKNKITGIICVDSESFKITSSKIKNKDRSISNTETSALLSPSSDAVASTSSTNNISLSRTAQNPSTSHLRPLLSRSGVTDHEVQYVAEEKDLFPALIRIIRKWDPDILIGYEVQMFSWGFLLERALTFEIDLCTWLSRVKGSSSASNMDAEKDQWGAAHTSEIKIAGRIILNVWRLMRHEVTLNSYSFENVAFHVLHERIPLYTFRTLSDWWDQRTSLNRWRTVDHYVRRCRGNVRILESVDFIGRTSELARLFGILFFSVICRGSQYRVESMMLRIAKPMNYIAVSPSVEQRALMRAPETIPLVMEPESRFYSDPVLVLDFQSLYPSMIIAYNYCFSTCLGRVSCLSEYGEFKFGATSLCVPPSILKKLEGDIHVSPNGIAFVKSNVRKGILPSMLDEILQTRIMVKASMKRWKSDKSLGRMLDARQLGLKLIANVTFGYTSAHFSGRMPCVEIGDSIVRKARETLERAIDLVNNTPRWGARVVYGDTDSLFVLLKGATKEQAFNIGKDIVDTVTAMNPKPVKLKFEKVYLPCVLQTKKRYVGYMYETLDQKEPVFDAKGIETVRRDSCPAVAKVLEKSLRFLFETRDLSLIKKFVQRQCTKLMEGRASLQDFTFAKEYRGMKNYKPGACVPALELTRRMLREDRRSEPRVGERVPYVVVYGSPGLPLIQLVRRPHEVLQDPGLRLNASYYITKQILPPLNRVFSLIGLDVFTWYADLPRVVRVVQMSTDPGDRKKGTISQYFSTMTCPVCQELTPTDLCTKCRDRPQLSAVSLANRMRKWERTHKHLAEICYSCCGSRDTKLSCVSLDCPVFYKLVLCTRDLKSSQHFRRILDSL